MAAKKSKSKAKIEAAMREVFANLPSTVKPSTPEKERKQKVAIGLAKVRKAGARIPKKKGMQ